jgi:hypothetical protein
MSDHPTILQAIRLHPAVREEQLRRIEAEPDYCHWAVGGVGPLALEPEPRWCARPIWHEGSHADAERLRMRRNQVREAVRRHRSQSLDPR